jgi:hypothetical protein
MTSKLEELKLSTNLQLYEVLEPSHLAVPLISHVFQRQVTAGTDLRLPL